MTDMTDFDTDQFILATLAEDLGGVADPAGDITAHAVFGPDDRLSAVLSSRDDVTVAGLGLAARFFTALDAKAVVRPLRADGDRVTAGTGLLEVEGRARALLAAERSALNLMQHLTGVATLTRTYVDAIDGTGATLLDTRKTLPGLRVLEKYAVRMGGGTNHRMGLYDAPMVKDNHIAAAGSIEAAVSACKQANLSNITVEVDQLDQIEPAICAGADRILLDNMAAPMLCEAVALVAGRVPTEASGGVNLTTIRAIAESGVDYVSVGRLTQSAPAADIGMDYLPAK